MEPRKRKRSIEIQRPKPHVLRPEELISEKPSPDKPGYIRQVIRVPGGRMIIREKMKG